MCRMTMRPATDEAADYYFTYIDQVPEGDIRDVLAAQLTATERLLSSIPEARAMHRYAPDKWTIKEVVSHINDTERVFTFRALWFGRGFEAALPGFDQNIAVPGSGANDRPLSSHVEDFHAVRSATLTLFRDLPGEAWGRRGVASGHPVTVRALAFITAGHVAHHVKILREKYL